MGKLVKHIVGRTCKPLLKRYLLHTRRYRYQNIWIEVPAGVFHPGFFFSTHYLLGHLKQFSLTGKTLLELGCGSGLISIFAAKQGALVVASDINQHAVNAVRVNSILNDVHVEAITSDLFERLEERVFDYIVINPPFFSKDPCTDEDYAWYCGENFDYFKSLFRSIQDHIHEHSRVIMILSDDCDTAKIQRLANDNGLRLILMEVKQNLLERNFIFTIDPIYAELDT